MYSVTRLLDVVEPDRDRILGECPAPAAAADPLRWAVEPTLPGTRNGGDILVHLRFDAAGQWDCAAERFAALTADPAVVRANGVGYSGEPVRCGDTEGTVYRALLLRVAPDTAATTVARFEHELSLMPRYVPAIGAWPLSRACDAVGSSAWTPVFEQE